MPKAPAEHVAEFLLEFLPGLLPKPADSLVESAIGTFKDTLGDYLKQPRVKRQLLEAAQGAESDFRAKAKEKLGNDELTQAVASFPLFDRELFQSTLRSLPDHLHEDYLADHLKRYIADDWKGKFTPAELREAAALYLNCLRVRLLKVDGYAELITRLAVLRTDERTEQILAIVQELLELVRALIAKGQVPQSVISSLVTIPPPVSDFIGREDELAQLKASFERGALISGVTGGGGIGKTELARKLAQELAVDYPDARMEINLRGADPAPLTSEDAMRRLLEPFYPNQKLPDDFAELRGLYKQTFAQNKSLLLLDNAADAAQVRPLIPPAPSAAIVTSRRHFSLTEFGFTPLRLDVLPEAQALQFLRNASKKLEQASEAEVKTLAKLCGFLPLALRVAASILEESAVWTPARLISRLQDERTRLERLKREGDRDLDVEASLSLSYDLLPDDLKKAFRLLSVFTAPFHLQNAQAVWGVDDDGEALDRLDKLVNRSLVNFVASSAGRTGGGVSIHPSDDSTAAVSAGRVGASEASDISRPAGEGFFSLHDLTRLFAYEKLQEAEARAAVLTHARHFLELASAANDLYLQGGENILPALTRFRFLYPHLRAAFARLSARQGDPDADRWLSDFPGRCASVLDLHLPPREQIPLLESAIAASRRLNDKNAEGVHLGNLGLAYAALGDARKAIEFYEQQLVIVREIGDRRGEGNALGNLGLAYADLSDARKAIEFYEQALAIDREIGDRRGEGNDLGNLGNAYADLGDARKAIEFYEERLEIAREIGDRRGEGNALANMGMAYKTLGEKEKARALWQEALAIFRAIEDPHVKTVEKWLEGLEGEEPEETAMSLRDFIRLVVQAHRSKAPQAAQLFDVLGKMASDENLPPEARELANVLQTFMSGRTPALSTLPEELAEMVREELGE
ncbi:MAG TPA: tetratricopeptide repeat protein [Anaerolineales bacterium]|nr:tetratricopeptide repeat protein [Anaerolineales bacterium]